jgi:hypothetical protein
MFLSYSGPTLLLLAWAVIGLVLARRSSGADGVALRAPVVTTLIVGVLAWSGPLIDQLGGSGNLGNVAGAVTHGHFARLGVTIAWRDLLKATGVPGVWMQPHTAIVVSDAPPGIVTIVTALVVLAALVAVTFLAWRHRRLDVAALGTTALVACIGVSIATASTPRAYDYTEFIYPRRFWWPVGLFVWIVLAYAAVTAVVGWEARGDRRPARIALAAGAVAMLVALVLAWPRLGVAQDYASGGFGPVRALATAAARVVPDGQPVFMSTEGAFAQYVVGPGVESELVLRGKDIVVKDAYFPDYGSAHVVDRRHPPSTAVLVVSGPGAGAPRPGYRLLASYDPNAAPAPFRGYHQTMLVIPLVRTAVYVSAPT